LISHGTDDRKDVAMRVCLFEDRGVPDLEPLILTRPVFELLCGWTSLADKQYRHFAASARGALIRPHLVPVYRRRHPDVAVQAAWMQTGPTLLVNGRWLPPSGTCGDLSAPCVGMVGDQAAYALLEPDSLAAVSPDTIDDCVARWKASLPRREAGGVFLQNLWDVVQNNGEQIIQDWEAAGPHGLAADGLLALVGPRERLVLDPTARIDPLVVADTTAGPVIIEREAVITAFTQLEGPCVIGPKTQVHGAKIRAGTTLGPSCRIGGEVDASIVQGHSNKYHEGFLGHAYLGEWVNLGAGTQNSDLRNDYGEVSMTVNGRVVGTGMTKVGCFLGDHTKTGLGTLLNTGTNVGVFCNLLPGGLLPKYIPSFGSWWNQTLIENGDVEALLHTAAQVMHRRGVAFTEEHANLYRTLFDQTAAERRRAMREAEQRRLRRSA
jgi:UDP-N-acetylglucosamine diphosphorylase/glucosamine-1-phosphate N-acetyltransferase